jgi:hypothetical protein
MWESWGQQGFYCISLMGWEGQWCLHSDWNFHRVWLRYTNRDFNRVGLRDWNLNFNWIGTINRYFNRDEHWHLNGVRLRDRDLLVNVHRVWTFYWNFNRDGSRYGYFNFNWIGTFDRDWYFNWDTFHNGDRSVYDNWVGMINRDFDFDGIGFRDRNWDLNWVWLRLRDSNRHFYRVGTVNRHWNFHWDGSVNWDFNFDREGFWDTIRYLNWHGVLDTNWVRLGDFNNFFDYLLVLEVAWVETAQVFANQSVCCSIAAFGSKAIVVSMYRQPPLCGVAFCGCRNCFGCRFWIQIFWPRIGASNGSQTDGENAQLWESKLINNWNKKFWTVRDSIGMHLVFILRSYRLWRRVVWKVGTDVSDKPATYIFCCEECDRSSILNFVTDLPNKTVSLPRNL